MALLAWRVGIGVRHPTPAGDGAAGMRRRVRAMDARHLLGGFAWASKRLAARCATPAARTCHAPTRARATRATRSRAARGSARRGPRARAARRRRVAVRWRRRSRPVRGRRRSRGRCPATARAARRPAACRPRTRACRAPGGRPSRRGRPAARCRSRTCGRAPASAGRRRVVAVVAGDERGVGGGQAQRHAVPAEHLGARLELEAQAVVGMRAGVHQRLERQPFEAAAAGDAGMDGLRRARAAAAVEARRAGGRHQCVGAVAEREVHGQCVAADDAARRMHHHRVADPGAFREQALEHAQRAVVAEVGAGPGLSFGGRFGAVVECQAGVPGHRSIVEWGCGEVISPASLSEAHRSPHRRNPFTDLYRPRKHC